MKIRATRNTILALLGLTVLTIYILACTSFSPDDTKVLYPAFDTQSGAVGIAVYDRSSKGSEMLFLPATIAGGTETQPRLLRAQWLADGRNILVAWPGVGQDDEDGLNLAVVPWGGRGTFRHFQLPEMKEVAEKMMLPVCVAGQRVFLAEASNNIIRLDLRTGVSVRHALTGPGDELALYPDPGGNAVFYAQDGDSGHVVFGRLDPETFECKPLVTLTNDLADGSFFAYDRSGKRLAIVEETEGARRLVVLQDGQAVFSRPLGKDGEKLTFGNAQLSPKGDLVLASFRRKLQEEDKAAFGLMEIPLNKEAIRETILIPAAESGEEMEALYFQAAVSHDGRTAALASTYLACGSKEFKAGDCALFLVDLGDPKRAVTRVPIPMPAKRLNPIK